MPSRYSSCPTLFACTLLWASAALPASAQLCPPRDGVVPHAIRELLEERPDAFQMGRAWHSCRPKMAKQGGVSGTLQAPVVPVLYSDTPAAPYAHAQLQDRLFGGGASLRTFYEEMSGGRLDVQGEVRPWQRLARGASYYAGSTNGMRPGDARVGELIRESLDVQDGSVDFGRFDNDGPDGVPNSGDDDGYVDFVAFVHPDDGAECGGKSTIWSHRWRYSVWPASGGAPFATNDLSANGGPILIDDYTIQPAMECGGQEPVGIGIFCHEIGHVFGLPDLYDLDGGGAGLGHWGLMASGNWNDPDSPAHMSAWTKQQLGWVETVVVDWQELQLEIAPVQEDPVVYEIPFVEDRWSRRADCALSGSLSLAVGLDAEQAASRGWGDAGYGNGWVETIAREYRIPAGGATTLEFDYSVDTEAAFDFGFVLLEVDGAETVLEIYDGVESGHEVLDLASRLDASVTRFRIKFRFRSDRGWSTEDGGYIPACAPFVVDDIRVHGGDFDAVTDFEQHAGGWFAPRNDHDNPEGERWLVEHRRRSGFDAHLPGEGLLIYHVDEEVIQTRNGNTGRHGAVKGIVIEEADGLSDLTKAGGGRGDDGDVWPGVSGASQFDMKSWPSAASNSGMSTRVRVENIVELGDRIHASLSGGFSPPVLVDVEPRKLAVGSNWVELIGAQRLRHGVQLRLARDGVVSRQATEVEWTDTDRVRARFDTEGLPTGEYDLVVENPDGQTAFLPAAIELRVATPLIASAPFHLEQNVPNPFNPRTTIRFSLASQTHARLNLYDIRGRHVRTLLDESLPAGPHDRMWDGKDDLGRPAASGVYFYRLSSADQSLEKKLLLLR